jgi:aminoglycoside phosphotransferase (APT) family kinase protein
VRTRPWSALVRVPVRGGDAWFKEAPPSLAFEPALTAWLAARQADCIPEVLAAEGTRLLTGGVGPPLADAQHAPPMEGVVARYAELQIELAGSVDELLALGVPDSRPEALGFPVEGPVPLSLIHEEVHGGNVLVRAGRPVLIDWAEASVSHPFAGTVNTLRVVAWHSEWEPGGPEVLRLRDAYLEPWTPFAPLGELREVYAQAYALGCLARAATWERVLLPIPPADRGDYEHNIGAWREIHEDVLREPERLGA